MPSSGYPSVDLTGSVILPTDTEEQGREKMNAMHAILLDSAKHAMSHGLFVEWLEAFVGAWEVTRDAGIASRAGLIEWDM